MPSLLNTLRRSARGNGFSSHYDNVYSRPEFAAIIMERFNFYKRRDYIKTRKQRKEQVRRLRLMGWIFESAGLYYFVSKRWRMKHSG